MAELVLGIDVGSSRTKALLMDAAGRTVASAVVTTPFTTTTRGTETTVAALGGALEEVLERLGQHRQRAAAVGIAGIAESGAPLDGGGEPIAPIIAWHDRRGEDVAARMRARFGPCLSERIGQRLRYVSSVAKLGWLLDHGLERPSVWLGVPELCLYALTGARFTECSLAARTGCWDVRTRSWLADVAESAGFGPGVMPTVSTAGTVMGRVSAGAGTRSGLRAGIPVTLAGHDHLVGVVGSGAGRRDLVNSVGTAETVVGRSASLPDIAGALERGLAVTVAPGGEGWAVLASAARAGLAVEAAAAALRRSAADLDALAMGAPVLDAPGLAESLRRRELPALPRGPEGAVWNTLLTSLAAATATAVGEVTGLLGPTPGLVVFGGGARSRPWLAAKARLLGLAVWRSTAAEAVARGAAVLGGVAAGWWPSPAAAPAASVERV